MKLKCNGCEKRFVGCHAQCEHYKAWKAEHDEQVAHEKQEKMLENLSWNDDIRKYGKNKWRNVKKPKGR